METTELDVLFEKYSPFLKEIRSRLFLSLIVFGVATGTGFLFYEKIIKLLIDILSLKGINIVFTSPFQFINLAISCGVALGLIAVFPILLYHILSFLKPALKKQEFNIIVSLIPFSVILFIFGFIFGIFTMRWQIQLSLSKSVALGIGNMLDVSRLIGTVLLVAVCMGVAFQFPIILAVLTRIGIFDHRSLSKQRLWVYLGSLIFTILLPIDSVVADIILTIPIILLFEITIILSRMKSKKPVVIPIAHS